MYRRIFALILAFAMVFSLLPGTAMATDETPETEPAATEAQETEPKETEPKETEPKETEPKETEPKETEPKATEAKETEPKETEPKETEPKETEPKETEPQETEPVVTEPVVTEPEETEPQATQPVETQPAPDQKVKLTNPGKRNTEITSITAKFSFEFPEESGLTEADVGSVDVILTGFDTDCGDPYTDDRMKISADNGWTAYFELEPGKEYDISVINAELDGYSYSISGDNTYVKLEAGESEIREYTVVYDYDDPGDDDWYEDDWYYHKLTVSLVFAEDSDLKDADVGDIIVHMEGEEESGSVVLSNANGRTAELQYESGGYYRISFNGLEQDGYAYSLEGDKEFYSYDNVEEITFTIKYTEGNPQFTVSLDFAEDSALKDSDIGNIVARIYDEDVKLVGQLALTRENGRTASIALEPGLYEVRFGGAEREGYNCSLPNWLEFYIDSGEGVTRSYTLRYENEANKANKAKLRISLDFAEDSALQDADIGDITVVASEEMDEVEMGRATLTRDGGRTAELTLPFDWYTIKLEGHEKEGYYCDVSADEDLWSLGLYSEDTVEVNITLRYVEDRAKLKLSLDFAEDSPFQDADIGDITAQIYKEDGDDVPVGSLVLTQANGRTGEITLPSGSYRIRFSGYEKDGYLCECDGWGGMEPQAYLTAGEENVETFELKYIKAGGKVTVDLDLDDDSVLDETAIGTITAGFYRYDTYSEDITSEPVKTVELTQDNDWTATADLPSGEYDIRFSGYEVEGYWCSLEDEYGYIEVVNGDELQEAYSFYYVKDECELTVSLDFASDSVIKDADVGEITAEIYRYEWTDDEESTRILVDTLTLTKENGRTGKVTLPSGSYHVYFAGYEKEGYYCTLEEHSYVWLYQAGMGEWLTRRVAYVNDESTLTVSLDFAEDSALSTDDFGDITAQIYRTRWEGWSDEPAELVGSVALTKENSRKGELTVKLDGYYETDVDSMEYGWNSDYRYELRLVGMEQEGYRYVLENADKQMNPMPGDEDGWAVTAKYAQAEHNVTVKVRLSDDSNVSPTKLKGKVSLNLEDTVGKMVNESVDHTGSKVFTHTFKNLPDSDRYHLDLDVGIGFLQSITCTGGELKKDLKKGQLEFSLNGDCEIEVVLELKKTADDEATLILRFTEDSALQAEDFPQGITLTAYHEFNRTYYAVDGTITFYPENDWTKVVKVVENFSFEISEHPEGYIGTVEGYVSIDDCPTTVYLDVCFEEYEPYYLDVELIFDENSDLKSDEVGSIFLDVNDSGTARSYEFKEGSWHQVIELHGDINSIIERGEIFSTTLRNLARPGYSYTVEYIDKEDFASNWSGRSDWERGSTKYNVVKICYTETPGKLVVDVVSSPYGATCDTIITVTDENGNEVAQVVCDYDNDYQCTIDLPGAGAYTVTPKVEEPSRYMQYAIDEPVTIQFDPADGAAVTLLCEERSTTTLEIFKFFGEDSYLGPEDFPDGITVTLTDVTGRFSEDYVLSDVNGWNTTISMPAGAYTATEKYADKAGYIRTTRFVFAYSEDYSVGGESLRPWDLRNREQETEIPSTSVTDGPVGGPYYIYGIAGSYNNLTIHNTYVSDPNYKSTGSITITAGDGFYDFDSNEKLDETPDTGNEVDEYTYIVDIDGEEQEITLKPGEEITIDGVAEGAVYTVTPVLPDGYPWNTDVTPITGTIGGETDSDEGWNVEVSFENDYYYTHEEGVLTIVKTDALTGEKLKGAQFGLYSDKDCTKQVAKATTGKDGTCSVDLTEEGTFYIKELKAPEDYYVKSEEVKTVTVTTEWTLETREGKKVLVQKLIASVADLSLKDGGYIWENERKTTDISVTKKFAYDEDLERPESVSIVLYQDGEAYETVKLSAANNWKYVWKDMPLGFEYTVDELNVAKGYYKQIRSSGYDFTVTNSGSILPQTGDMTNIALWGVLALASIAALTVLIYKRKKKA